MEQNFELNLIPEASKQVKGWKSLEFSTTATSASSMRGSAITSGYRLQPITFLRKAIDAAKERMMFLQVAEEKTLPEGHKDMIWPIRKKYLPSSSWETSAAEYAIDTNIPSTEINTAEGRQFTPVNYNYMVTLTEDNIKTNALDAVGYARDELSYRYEDKVDSAISTALTSATGMSNTVWGMQTIFGGDATDAANNLDAGDTLNTDMIAKMRRLIMSKKGYYWNSNAWTASAVTKNPWAPDVSEPLVLFIAPEQEEALLTNNTQFTNAAEYGANNIVLNGQIGRYLGVNVISTTKTPDFASADTIVHQAGTVTMDVAGHQCLMVKAKRSVGVAYRKKADMKVFDWPVSNQVKMTLGMAYHSLAIHPDAIVKAVVADE